MTNYKMNEGRNSKYYYEISERITGKVILSGHVTGGNKQDCRNAVDNIARQAGIKPYANDHIKIYMKAC